MLDHIQTGHLPAELTTNGSGGSGYEDCFVAETVADPFHIDGNFFPAQDVFYGYGAYVKFDGVFASQLIYGRDHHDVDLFKGAIMDEPVFLYMNPLVAWKQDGFHTQFVYQFSYFPLCLEMVDPHVVQTVRF